MSLILQGSHQIEFEFDPTIKWVKSKICHSQMYQGNVHYWTITSNEVFIDKIKSLGLFSVFKKYCLPDNQYLITLDNVGPIPELELIKAKEYFDILCKLTFFNYAFDSVELIDAFKIRYGFNHPNLVSIVVINCITNSIGIINNYNLLNKFHTLEVTNDNDTWNKMKDKTLKILFE